MHAQRWMMIGGAVLALVAAACSAERKRVTAADIAGSVVLETYSVNLGWNYQLRGMYIDGDGGVWVYELQGRDALVSRAHQDHQRAQRTRSAHQAQERPAHRHGGRAGVGADG